MTHKQKRVVLLDCVSLAVMGCQSASAIDKNAMATDTTVLNAATLPDVRTMDDRFQSFQIGMSHLTGGETWKAYGDGDAPSKQAANFQAVREAARRGLANRANPIGIVAPCHRVIESDGGLGGYGRGVERKAWLLRHEGALAT